MLLEFNLRDLAILLGIVATVVGALVRYEKRINQIFVRLTALEAKIEPFWGLVKANLPRLFEKNPPSRVLLKKLSDGTLTEEEKLKLKGELKTGLHSTKDKFSYLLVLTLLEMEEKGKWII